MQNGELEGFKAKVIVLMIGTNNITLNTSEEIAAGVEAICATIHQRSAATKILLLAIFPRGQKPDAIRAKVDDVNHRIADLATREGNRAVVDRARTQQGEWVVVVGAGGVGLSAVMVAASLGAKVIAVDRSQAALELAATMGAEHVVMASADTPRQVAELTGGGAHVSVEAVGSEQTAATAIGSLRRRGRHVQGRHG